MGDIDDMKPAISFNAFYAYDTDEGAYFVIHGQTIAIPDALFFGNPTVEEGDQVELCVTDVGNWFIKNRVEPSQPPSLPQL